MVMFGLDETIEEFVMANSVCWYGIHCEGRMVMFWNGLWTLRLKVKRKNGG